MEMNKRIARYDNMKYLLILLVVIAHFFSSHLDYSQVISGLYLYIYSFHMPAFFFLSGLFNSSNKRINMTRVVGYLFLALLIIILKAIMLSKPITLLGGDGWFLICLSSFEIGAYLLRDVKKISLFLFAICLALFAAYDTTLSGLMLRECYFFFYYLLGYVIDPIELQTFVDKETIKYSSIIISIGILLLIFTDVNGLLPLRKLLYGSYNYQDVFDNCGFIYRIIQMLIAVISTIAFISIVPTKNMNHLTHHGRNTLGVYFIHIFVYKIFDKIGIFDSLYKAVGSFAIIIYLILIVIIVYFLSADIVARPFKRLLGVKV